MSDLRGRASRWAPAIDETRARAVLEVVHTVVSKLSSKPILNRAIAETQSQTAFPETVQWIPYSISQGYAGLAVLWAQMDACFPGNGWDLAGREHLALAARNLERNGNAPLGIFSGLTGVAFAAWQLSKGGTRYRRLLQTLDNAIVVRTIDLANRLKGANGCAVSEFDVISGLAGVGAYLLCRADDAACAGCLRVALEALVTLLNSPEDLPRWYTPAKRIGDAKTAALYPHGCLNCGLAHGIPGPLALLALAHLNGISTEKLPAAITRTADWLCDNRCDDAWGANWPTAVAIQSHEDSGELYAGSALAACGGPSRSAWCYGTPGVARALWLAGQAVGQKSYKDLAISAMEAVFRRPREERQIDSPSFCHGVAGLLQVTLRFANDSDDSIFRSAIDSLLQQILDAYAQEFPVGFRHLEIGSNQLDQPGFLDGASGIAAVLLAAATNIPPVWDRLFLLS